MRGHVYTAPAWCFRCVLALLARSNYDTLNVMVGRLGVHHLLLLTLTRPQSRFGDKLLVLCVRCPHIWDCVAKRVNIILRNNICIYQYVRLFFHCSTYSTNLFRPAPSFVNGMIYSYVLPSILKIYGRARRDGCPGESLQTDGGVGAALRQKGVMRVPAVVFVLMFFCRPTVIVVVSLCSVCYVQAHDCSPTRRTNIRRLLSEVFTRNTFVHLTKH